MLRRILFIYAALGLSFLASSQEIEPPSPGKAKIYFVRFSGTGALINFKYFHGEKYLGKFSGVNYFIYETDPGDHLFWVSAENRDFLEAKVEAGNVYLVEVRPTMGAIKSAVRMFPVLPTDDRSIEKIKKIMGKKSPIELDKADFSNEAESLEFYISNALKKYQSIKADGKEVPKLLPEHSFMKKP